MVCIASTGIPLGEIERAIVRERETDKRLRRGLVVWKGKGKEVYARRAQY